MAWTYACKLLLCSNSPSSYQSNPTVFFSMNKKKSVLWSNWKKHLNAITQGIELHSNSVPFHMDICKLHFFTFQYIVHQFQMKGYFMPISSHYIIIKCTIYLMESSHIFKEMPMHLLVENPANNNKNMKEKEMMTKICKGNFRIN